VFSCINTSCTNGIDSKRKVKQEITVNIGAEPAKLDSRKARFLTEYNIIRTFNEGLFRIDKNGVVTEAIANNFSLVDEGKTYKISLKKTYWSNGDRVTAHDFINTWKSIFDKDILSPSAFLLLPIKNARAIRDGLLSYKELKTYAVDDYTIVMELDYPMQFFIELLSLPIFFPVHQKMRYEHLDFSFNTDEYICNGPFKLSSWEHGNKITADKNNYYWDKNNVKLQKINMIMVDENIAFNMFQNKQLDHLGSPLSNIPSYALKHLTNNETLKKHPFLGTYWIRLNTKIHPLHDKNFRKSLACSINRKEIADHLFDGKNEVATGIIPPSISSKSTPYFKDGDNHHALEFFNLFLKDNAYTNEEIPALTLTFINTNSNQQSAKTIQEQWRECPGISVHLEPLEYKVFIDRINKKDYQLAYGAWIADYNDPIVFLEVFKDKETGTNNTNWENSDYKNAMHHIFECTDKSKRKTLILKAEEILINEMPIIPMHHLSMIYLQNPHLKDLVFTETGIIDLKWAYFED
jgi:oligopeptide transport system substrate-binding protein